MICKIPSKNFIYQNKNPSKLYKYPILNLFKRGMIIRGKKILTIILAFSIMFNIFLLFQEKAQGQEIDYIIIVDTPGVGLVEIPDLTVDVGTTISGYAAAFNNTSGYIGDVSVEWSVINSGGAQASTSSPNGTSSTFNAGSQGGTAVWQASYFDLVNSYNDTVMFTINPPEVDYIQIMDPLNPSQTEILNQTVGVGKLIPGYASAFNTSGGYIGNIDVNWSVNNTSGGQASTDPLSGTSSTFNSGSQGGSAEWTIDDGAGHVDSVFFTILSPTLDWIHIVDTPNSGTNEITDLTVVIGTTIWGYAAGFNDSIGYFSDISVTWSVQNSGGANASTDPVNGTGSLLDAGVTAGQAVWTADTGSAYTDNVTLIISDEDFDTIIIQNSTTAYAPEIPDQSVGAGVTVKGYAGAYNSTWGFAGLISVTWSVNNIGSNASTNPGFGISSSFYSGDSEGTSIWTAGDFVGHNDNVTFTITSLTIDYIEITDAPNGSPLTNVTLSIGGQITAYASGYNVTSGYVDLVEVNWNGSGGIWILESGTYSTFFAGNITGSFNQTGENITLGISDSFNVIIGSHVIDYIILSELPNGTELETLTMGIGEQITAYASAYNLITGYIGLIEVNWSQSPTLGSLDNFTGTSTTFTTGLKSGTTTITGENLTLGVNDTFEITIINATADYIQIRNAPSSGGSIITNLTLIVSQSFTLWATVYNYSLGYIGDFGSTTWTEISGGLVITVTSPGEFTVVQAQLVGGSSTITASYYGVQNFTNVTVTPPTDDYLIITEIPDGPVLTTVTLPVGGQVMAYASVYNLSSGFIDLVEVNWSESGGLGLMDNLTGTSTLFTAGLIEGFTTVLGENTTLGLNDTFDIIINPPSADYIQIRDSSGGSGNIIKTRTYVVWELDLFYAAGYNHTAGYIGEVKALWTSNDTAVGKVTSPGLWTNFTAQKVDKDIACHVIVAFDGIINSTEDLLVLAPTIDFIVIMDAPNHTGTWVSSRTYNEGEKDIFWAAGFNLTADYIKDVKATWESNNTVVGKVTYGPNENTNFTAGWRGGYFHVTATYNSLTNQTGSLFVINVNTMPTAKANYYNGTGFTGGDFSFSTDITLRVTGRKENIISMMLEEDGIVVENVVVTRHSHNPDIGIISYEMDVHNVYEVVLSYNGHNGGSNPIIVTFEFLGNIYSVHMLFNSQHGEIQKARIAFNDVLQLVGVVFLDASMSSDFEGYIVNYQWDFGDGTTAIGETLAHTYVENTVYFGILTVADDEGGTNQNTISVNVENIDNNDQANVAFGNKEIKGYLNASGEYVVILQCPADLRVINRVQQRTGIFETYMINEIENAFIAMLFGDVEVYYIPKDTIYTFEVVGTGKGYYDLGVIAVDNNIVKKYNVYNVTCSENTQDTYIIDFAEEKLHISTNEENKIYSLEFLKLKDDRQDFFFLTNMKLDENTIHQYQIKDWEELSSDEPVILLIDKNSDGVVDNSVNLKTGHSGDDVLGLLQTNPVSPTGFPILLFIIGSVICALGVGTFLTEIGKWAFLTLFLPLYTRLKKEELLDQPTRYKIYGFIRGNPGAHFGLIKEDLELGSGQLVYHLKQLKEAKLIYSREDGIKKRFYPANVPKPKSGKPQLSELQEKILGIIKRDSGIGQKKIASSMGITRQVAGYHLLILERKGVINKRQDGRKNRYYSSEEYVI
jgi:DNA-binding transcriptional ArsR family regulator